MAQRQSNGGIEYTTLTSTYQSPDRIISRITLDAGPSDCELVRF